MVCMAWPAMLENLLQSAIFMINTALVGRLGAEALSAAGISNFPMFFGLTPVAGLGVGVLAQVARAKGRRNLSEAQRIGWHSLVIGVALSLGTTALFVVFAEPILGLVARRRWQLKSAHHTSVSPRCSRSFKP